jgi:two-component system, LuxR family, response regulator FixJ
MVNIPTVYVVDDDQGVLLSVRAVLEQNGYRADCYSSAVKFLERAVLDHPSCVITDLNMPEITGVELQQRLLAAESVLSVVVVTGVADVPTTVQIMEKGAVTLLEKPYSHVELVDAVKRGLAASQARWEQQRDQKAVLEHLAKLTQEERKVMEYMLAGEPNKTISHRLDLSMRTVDRRRQAVLDKMGAKTVPGLALLIGKTQLTEQK